jgi:hypothetical protein
LANSTHKSSGTSQGLWVGHGTLGMNTTMGGDGLNRSVGITHHADLGWRWRGLIDLLTHLGVGSGLSIPREPDAALGRLDTEATDPAAWG